MCWFLAVIFAALVDARDCTGQCVLTGGVIMALQPCFNNAAQSCTAPRRSCVSVFSSSLVCRLQAARGALDGVVCDDVNGLCKPVWRGCSDELTSGVRCSLSNVPLPSRSTRLVLAVNNASPTPESRILEQAMLIVLERYLTYSVAVVDYSGREMELAEDRTPRRAPRAARRCQARNLLVLSGAACTRTRTQSKLA